MPVHEYIRAEDMIQVHELLGDFGSDAKMLAGGTDLIVQMRAGAVDPRVLIDIKPVLPRFVRVTSGMLSLGAGVTHSEMAASTAVQSGHRALAEASLSVGGPALRNRATVGGNVANASPVADSVPPLVADGGQAVISDRRGERRVAVEDLFTSYRRTQLGPAEVLTAFEVPAAGRRSASGFIKVGGRKALIIAMASVACRLSVNEDGVVTRLGLAFGSVGPTVIVGRRTGQRVVGSAIESLDLDEVAESAASEISPITDFRGGAPHRARLIRVHTRRLVSCLRDELIRELADG